MTWQLFFSILAFLGICAGLLFLSLIHLFMIPKDVMDRDTGRLKARANASEGELQLDGQPDREREREAPEEPMLPDDRPEEPRAEPVKEPEVDRQPGQKDDPEPEKGPGVA